MAEQNRKQTGRSGPRGSDAPSDPYGLGLNIGMLDWTQLEPLGDAEAMAAAGQDLDFLPDLPNELLDEGKLLMWYHRFYDILLQHKLVHRGALKGGLSRSHPFTKTLVRTLRQVIWVSSYIE